MDHITLPSLAIPPLLAGAAYLSWRYLSGTPRSRLPHPPGPKGLPILKNVFDIPMKYEWLTYQKYAKQYGDIVYLEALGRSIMVIDSLEITNDLLDRRGGVYSDRPEFQMVELCGFMFPFSSKRYGEVWRTHRRHFHQHVHQNVADQYQPIQQWSTHMFLRQIIEAPEDFLEHTREMLGRTILRMTYDIKTIGKDDPHVTVIDQSMRMIDDAVIPGKYFVEFIPQMRNWPDWMPGMAFKQAAARCRAMVELMIKRPFDITKTNLLAGTGRPSIVSRLLEEGPQNDPAYEQMVMELGGIAYVAGADTTFSVISGFFLAMRKFPAAAERAREELDAVVGADRMPEYADRANLPYVEALFMEVFRWIPALPMGGPRMTTEDDEYRGYFIPKNTIIMVNVWSMLHDPEVFPDPEAFKPERFLKEVNGKLTIDEDVRDPRVIAFGTGRRICPGRFIAQNSIWLLIASFLHTIKVEPAVDAEGKQIDVPGDIKPGFTSHVVPFKCSMKPRSARAEALIREAEVDSQI